MSNSKKKQDSGFAIWSFLLTFLVVLFFIFLKKKRTEEIPDEEILIGKIDKKKKIRESKKTSSLNNRQEKVLKLLSSKGEITVEDLMGKIKGVSERTFRRDMQKLEKLGLSKKEGSTKGSKYIYTQK